jgi:hypothetical protein
MVENSPKETVSSVHPGNPNYDGIAKVEPVEIDSNGLDNNTESNKVDSDNETKHDIDVSTTQDDKVVDDLNDNVIPVPQYVTSIPHAEEQQNVIISQLKQLGVQPLEYIPLNELKAQIEVLINKLNNGIDLKHTENYRLEYLMSCLTLNPEYRAEQDEVKILWRIEAQEYAQECLQIIRGFIPPDIFTTTRKKLKQLGMTDKLIRRLYNKKCLWLCRLKLDKILTLHEVELTGKYFVSGQNLDIVELAAVYAVLPDVFLVDDKGKKEVFKINIEDTLMSMMESKKKGLLEKNKIRHSDYDNNTPMFSFRESLYSFQVVKNSSERSNSFLVKSFEKRNSFLEIDNSKTVESSGVCVDNDNVVATNRILSISERKAALEKNSKFVKKTVPVSFSLSSSNSGGDDYDKEVRSISLDDRKTSLLASPLFKTKSSFLSSLINSSKTQVKKESSQPVVSNPIFQQLSISSS